MRDDFEIDTVEGVRVAMTHAQADALGLPKNIKADEKESSNLPKFLAAHGRDDCYELEAVEPDVLQGWLDEAIRSVIDVEAFNHESEKENAEAAEIQAQQEAVREFLKTRK
jgi:hypothetical protein